MKNFILIISSIISVLFSASQNGNATDPDSMIHLSLQHHQLLDENTYGYNNLPRSIKENGYIRYVTASDWTSGFFPGSLWYFYDYFKTEELKELAWKYTKRLSSQQHNTGTHDIGFMIYNSYGNGYKFTGDTSYTSVLMNAANSLKTRFDPEVGCIRSWDFGSWDFPVIIDNMMNLELLFWAAAYSGDSTFYNIAFSHAEKTMENHYRDDFTCYHVVDYNSSTGVVISKETFQGEYDESSWARGQSWGLYSFVMIYRETGDKRFLNHAKKIASYLARSVPSDYIPYWDYKSTKIPDTQRDASAASIMASAFLELSLLDPDKSEEYRLFAEQIIETLSSPEYFSDPGESRGFILKHSVGHMPHTSEVDVPIIYADYYYVEALVRLSKIFNASERPGEAKTSLKLFPNPSAGRIQIQSNRIIQEIRIYNLNGKQVYSRDNNSDKIILLLQHLNKGIYFLEIIDDTGTPDLQKLIIY